MAKMEKELHRLMAAIENIRNKGDYIDKKELILVADRINWFDDVSKDFQNRRNAFIDGTLEEIAEPEELERIKELEEMGHFLEEAVDMVLD